jgi:uncharacterized Zn finger protein
MRTCPCCGSEHYVKNGSIHTGKQKYLCKECGRQFVADPQNTPIQMKRRRSLSVNRVETPAFRQAVFNHPLKTRSSALGLRI